MEKEHGARVIVNIFQYLVDGHHFLTRLQYITINRGKGKNKNQD
jgi:hypothetical protein